jgi:adenine-specific DNA-methyltransferase
VKNFGEDAVDTEGNLGTQWYHTPRGRQYLELRERVVKAKSRPESEAEIFNHLYAFFSRYYDEGDFMSLRRYFKRDKYAIPYNGEVGRHRPLP